MKRNNCFVFVCSSLIFHTLFVNQTSLLTELTIQNHHYDYYIFFHNNVKRVDNDSIGFN